MSSKKAHNLLHYLLTFLYVLTKSLIGGIVWLVLAGIGYLIFQSRKTPYFIVIGLPLLLAAGGMAINSIWSAVLALFSPAYNRGVCIFCNKG